MKTNGTKRISLLLTALLIASPFVRTYAQDSRKRDSSQKTNPVTVSDDLLKACQQATVELEHYKNLDKLNADEKRAMNDQIAALERLVETHKKIAQTWEEEASKHAQVEDKDKQIIVKLQEIIDDFKSERARLIKERDRARLFGKVLLGVGLIVGAVIMNALKNK